jgi:PAS domain-containing protein
MNLVDIYRLLRNAHIRAQSIVDTIPEPLLVLDNTLCVESASRSFYDTFRVSPEETLGRPIYDLGDGQWNIPELRHLLEEVLAKSTAVVDYEVEHNFPSVGRRAMLVSAHRLFQPDGGQPAHAAVGRRCHQEPPARSRIGCAHRRTPASG